MGTLQHSLFELIDRFNDTRNAAQAQDHYRKFLSDNGFDVMMARAIGNPFTQDDSATPHVYDGPAEWRDRYLSKKYVYHDPNVLKALRTQKPFLWSIERDRASGLSRKIVDEAAQFGLREGLCLPVHSLDQRPAAVGIAGVRAKELNREDLLTMSLAATHFFVSWSSFQPHERELIEALTPRERDVLYCAAAGLTGDRLEERLGITEHTLRTHMRSIRQKLHAQSMAHAVAKGIFYGEISP